MKKLPQFQIKPKVAKILNNCKKIVFNKYIGLTILFFLFSFSVANSVSAQFVSVFDSIGNQARLQIEAARKAAEAAKDAKQSLGSKLFHSTLGTALNTIAYDTATWLGSGGEGQKPLFVTEGWGEYFGNVADNAAGSFIETLGQENGYALFNLCEPDLAVKMKIGMGLVRQQRPAAPACTFTEMKKNWEEELDDPNFLIRAQDMFDPTSHDIGIALTLHTKVIEDAAFQEGVKRSELESKEGWLDVRNAADYLRGMTGLGKVKAEKITDPFDKAFKWTGDVVVDAANIFLNQLAITAINTLMKNLAGDDPISEPYPGDWGGFMDYEAGPRRSGIAGAKERFRELIEPSFNTRGDYNILTELSICPNPNKAGPTNCVLSDRFRQAIETKITLGQAIDDGYLNLNGVFGFTSGGMEPPYNEGYPYRSMVILRKFRILPVGWEIAAQFIKDNPSQTDGVKNLGDMVACFSADDDYEGYFKGWCEGLVDPGWVLKAPQNYCKREGPGPEIMSETVSGEEENSRLAISRNDTYCADEQACIKEDQDGDCELFGYCTEERRTWDFGQSGCEPLYNTCQTFRSREGDTASYLENTLDYGVCSLDNVGCKAYCEDYDYISDTFTCGVTTDNVLFADIDIETCGSEAEGCHEFIRTKAGTNANLLINSSFENIALTDIIDDAIPDTFDSWASVGLALSGSYHGSIGLGLGAGGLSATIQVGASGFSLAGQIMTLSLYAKDCQVGDRLELDTSSTTLSAANDWQYYSVTHIYPPTTVGNSVNINVITNSCVIDAIKLEFGNIGSAYGDYRQAGLINQKFAPDYLGCSSASPGAECGEFARECGASEVGCELYSSASDGLTVPAQVTIEDYCPAVCVGYDEYLQADTYFDSIATAQFIPDNARNCSAQSVGCDEFTNLDRVGEGAEAREYYSYLKQCVDPGDTWPAASCQGYYTWEGSADTGYQLRVFMLASDGGGAPYLTNSSGIYDGLTCDESTYNLEINPMCREFFTNTGARYYRFYPYTVTCSDDCHPYRRTEQNIMADIGAAVSACQAECGVNANCLSLCNNNSCVASASDNDRTCEFASGEAVFCKNGGFWRSDHRACIYMAIPDEGVRCSAGQAGCREYSGNMGNNMREIFRDNFEGSIQNWSGVGATGIGLSNNALMVGGESLAVSNGSGQISKILGTAVRQNKTYVLQFLAQAANAPVNLTADIGGIDFVGSAGLDVGLWNIYELNISGLDIVVDDATALQISGNGDFFIDNIRLIEIIDRYFVIKDSWNTPEVCYEDIMGNYRGPVFNLGCDIYTDRDSNIHYLHGFTRLCDESAVGCELMIDTYNYTDYTGDAWNDNNDGSCAGDGRDCVVVPDDEYKFVVYDPDKLCNSNDQGCELFGNAKQYGDYISHSAIYLKNDPDDYNTILCEEEAEGCESWTAPDYIAYFKDPNDMSCEWREPQATSSVSWSWFKLPVKRCDDDSDGKIGVSPGPLPSRYPLEPTVCQTDNDCGAGVSCIKDNNDYLCVVDQIKTIGYGGQGNRVGQPTMDIDAYNWAGLCPSSQAGCSEYIDPISSFGVNAVFNADFAQDVDINGVPDGWSSGGAQDVNVEPFTLYRLAGENNSGALALACDNPIFILNEFNILAAIGTSYTLNLSGVGAVSRLVYTANNTACEITVSSMAGKISLKEAVIDYQIRQKVDRKGCNGIVDFEQGCILFNERTRNGAILSGFVWDADLTIDDADGVSPQVGGTEENDANTILRVSPNRICDKWLACKSYIKDENDNPVCFNIGLCNSVDNNGNCNNFVITNQNNQTYPSLVNAGMISNMSGYVKADHNNSLEESDLFPLAAMEQIGETSMVANGGFEWAGSNGYPIGWQYGEGISWDDNVFVVIDNPYSAQEEGIGYAPIGNNFLKLGSTHHAVSEWAEVLGGITYVLTAYINTINLSDGIARLQIKQYDGAGSLVQTDYDVVNLEPGNKWTYRLGSFKTDVSATRIEIMLHSNTDTVGNFYFDDIKLRPALNSRRGEGAMITVIQDDSIYYIPMTFSTAETATEFYNYTSASFNNPAFYSFIEADRSELFVHYSTVTGRISAVFFHDYPNDLLDPDLDSDGGLLTFDFTDISSGNRVAVNDDPGEGGISAGDAINPGDSWTWAWANCCTDGGMIEMPTGDWSITIEPNFTAGINKWAYIHNDGEIVLDPNKPVTLIYRENLKEYTPQTCRLYPENDSLSCEYYEDSGIRKKGWLGYCLEYDRYPGSKDTCLLWHPLDKVKGEGIEEGAGYNGRYPLYYSVEKSILDITTSDDGKGSFRHPGPCGAYSDAHPEYQESRVTLASNLKLDNSSGLDLFQYLNKNYINSIFVCIDTVNGDCSYSGTGMVTSANNIDLADGSVWFHSLGTGNSGSCQKIVARFDDNDNLLWATLVSVDNSSNASYSDGWVFTGTVKINFQIPFGNQIVQVITSTGQNKYWSGRVYQGSDYEVLCNQGFPAFPQICRYSGEDSSIPPVFISDYSPFGSVMPPYPVNNPYEWDSKDDIDGNQPLYYEEPDKSLSEPYQARMGQVHTIEPVKRLFAESYGIWEWDGSNYVRTTGDWTPPTNLCASDPRPAYPGDLCGIPPTVFNIMANNQANNILISDNQFINLTFNSDVDAEQLPLVMYAVDWGDNEHTTVSGVEMRNRINADNPHSLYHLYGYWDLKAKNAVNQTENNVYCGAAGADALNYSGTDSGIDCPAGSACCAIQPKVKIKDNWGWCNNGVNGSPCPVGGYELFGGWVVINRI